MDIASYKNQADTMSKQVERLGANANKIDFNVGKVDGLGLVMPTVLSVVLVIGALVGLTIWLVN